MGMVFGALTIIAGVIYLLWQVHKESRGFISCMLFVFACICAPVILIYAIGEINRDLAAILSGLLLIAVIVGGVYAIFNSDKWARKSLDESLEIWREVNDLPLPDEDTIRKYKLANKIPLRPENVKAYNDAAIRAWRTDEYNKRFEAKHKLTFRVK